MILLFVIIAHYINYEYSNTFSEHSQMIIYGLHPDYKNNFEYPKSCNQYRMVDVYMKDIDTVLDLDWNIYNNDGKFNYWQSEYINRYDYEQNQHYEFDFFVNYLMIKNEILNVSSQYNDIMGDLYTRYGINIMKNTDTINRQLNQFEEFEKMENEIENEKRLKRIKNLDKIDKIKYDKIKFTYDPNYLTNLFESLDTTFKFTSLYEIWKCSI